MEGEPWVKCYRANAAGREQILKVFDRRGDTFCMTSAFKAGKHIVSATTMSEATLYVVDIETVKQLAREHRSFAVCLVSTAGDQLQSLAGLAEDLSLKSVTMRLAKLLYEVALTEGVRNGKEMCLRRDKLPGGETRHPLGRVAVLSRRAPKAPPTPGAARPPQSSPPP